MWKKIILLMGISLLLIISGCKGGSSQGKSITDEDVRIGKEGLLIDFIKNSPPDSVYEGGIETQEGIFPLGINLKNKGASDIDKGILVFGFEKQYIEAVNEDDGKHEFDIKGKSIFNLNGDEEFITINANSKQLGDQTEKQVSTILATACYQYKTVLGTSVCIDTDIFGTELRDKACEVKDEEFSKGQGAPLTITKVETRMLPDADGNVVIPHFIIHIENKGNGEVINPNNYEKACSSEALNSEDFNRIKIKVQLSEEELDCSTGIRDTRFDVVLRDKKDIVRCTLENGIEKNSDAYTTPLKIELEYGYTFTISKDITIQKILKY